LDLTVCVCFEFPPWTGGSKPRCRRHKFINDGQASRQGKKRQLDEQRRESMLFDRAKKARSVVAAHQRGGAPLQLALVCARVALFGLFAVGLAGSTALADVASIGDVWIDVSPGGLIQDDFTTLFNEGIPTTGNLLTPDPFFGTMQVNWEGRPDEAGTANVNFDIVVGRSASGQLNINGSVLRDQDLIIGDIGPRPGGGPDRQGTGTVRIEGPGALYNNDPTILPYPATTSPSVNDRPLDVGFDLFVGRAGFGTLRIALGGRAEIQDATIVGDDLGSVGTLTVDGFDSMLASGGYDAPAAQTDDIHQMIIGRLGTGIMEITNGAQVLADVNADVAAAAATTATAVIGSDPYLIDQVPDPGGQGIVTLSGANSKWNIRGSLQVGGFHDEDDGPFQPDDESEGDDVIYSDNIGHGTLNVGQGTFVNLIPPDPEALIRTLDLVIGRFGQVNMTGGQITIGTNIGDPLAGERSDLIRLLNDGEISGGGRIDTGIFRNRYLGELEVNINQKLIIDATAEFDNPSQDGPPMINWGVIRVIGNHDFKAELDFERLPGTDPLTRFLNLRLTTTPATGRAAGLIRVEYGIVRFRSGITNQGSIVFTGGDNVVTGDVFNSVGDSSIPAPNGVIAVSGVGTHVLFENSITNAGTLDISLEAESIDIWGDFANIPGPDPSDPNFTGVLSVELFESSPFRLNIVGNAMLGGTLQASLAGPVEDGDVFNVLSAIGDMTGRFHSQVFPDLGPDLTLFPNYDEDLDTLSLIVRALAAFVGADFNGDGVVDELDLAVWEDNVGLLDGASPLQGDADRDGDVDGDDFILWQEQLGPVPGAGSGSGTGSSVTVPEPSSLALLVAGSLLALAFRRQR
jgi:T5SS/PEP-CTERM-associated repeat protein